MNLYKISNEVRLGSNGKLIKFGVTYLFPKLTMFSKWNVFLLHISMPEDNDLPKKLSCTVLNNSKPLRMSTYSILCFNF